MLFVFGVGYVAIYCIVLWLKSKFAGEQHYLAEQRPQVGLDIDRERAIDAWERKWGRKHPSRI